MKSFRQFLDEAFHSAMINSRTKEPVEIFKNPSRKELKSVTEYGEAGGWLHGKDLYVFNRMKGIHFETKPHMNFSSEHEPVSIMLAHNNKNAHVLVTDATSKTSWHHNPDIHSYITNHPHLTKMFPEGVGISYWDESIHGPWHHEK